MRPNRRGWPGSPWLIAGVLAAAIVVVLLVAWPTNKHESNQIEPDAVYSASALTLDVRFPFRETGFCVGQFTLVVSENAGQVKLGEVVDHGGKGPCAGIGSNGKYAWVTVKLTSPLGNREVVRQSDGVSVPRVLTLT